VLNTGVRATLDNIEEGFASEIVDGTYEWADAWKSVKKEIIKATLELAAYAAVMGTVNLLTGGSGAIFSGGLSGLGALGGLFGGATGGYVTRHGVIPGYATGGLIMPRGDNMLIGAQDGEYMFKREAVRYWGKENLDAMNNVPAYTRRTSPTAGTTLVVNLSGNTFLSETHAEKWTKDTLIPILKHAAWRGELRL